VIPAILNAPFVVRYTVMEFFYLNFALLVIFSEGINSSILESDECTGVLPLWAVLD
jgi:hypothetical protein